MEVRGIPEPAGWKDPLTGLEGPDAWQRTLVTEIVRSARYGRALTAVVIEFEGVLELGDELGVDVARHAMHAAAQCLHRACRASDTCFRIGLTRFGVILTETDEIAAINFVERVRESAPAALPRGGEGLTFSFGWASPTSGDAADVLVRRADHRLLEELLR